MPADFTFSGITVAPGRQTWWFTLGPQETIPTEGRSYSRLRQTIPPRLPT
jgi:hypothetical protein